MAGVTVKIDPHSSELQYSGRNCFMGYKDNDRDTKSTIDEEVRILFIKRVLYILEI